MIIKLMFDEKHIYIFEYFINFIFKKYFFNYMLMKYQGKILYNIHKRVVY